MDLYSNNKDERVKPANMLFSLPLQIQRLCLHASTHWSVLCFYLVDFKALFQRITENKILLYVAIHVRLSKLSYHCNGKITTQKFSLTPGVIWGRKCCNER